MNLSEEEKKKFMSMVALETYAEGKKFIEDLSGILYVDINFSEDHKSVKSIYVAPLVGRDFSIILSYDNNGFDFIASIIDKISPKIELVYSNNEYVSYSLVDPEDVSIECTSNYNGVYKAWLNLSGGTYCLSDRGCTICNNVLEALCTDDENKHDLFKIYVLHPESMSKKICDMIKPFYDELPASDKLLLELGEDI